MTAQRSHFIVVLAAVIVAAGSHSSARGQCGGPFKLTASDRAASDYFGYSVAVSGDTAVVGAYGDDSGKGAAYVYRWDGFGWAPLAKLTAADGAAADRFGRWVAISGDTIVIGAYYDDVGANSNQGSAYVFVKPPAGWATTSAYTAKLTASDGAASDYFGCSVAISGDTIVVGAYADDDRGSASGSAYVFVKAPGGWAATSAHVAKLTAADGAASDYFGYSVAVSASTIVVGAYFDDVGANSNQGSAYVFAEPAGGWVTTSAYAAKLTASDGAASDFFGCSVAVADNAVVVGAYGDDDNGDTSGSAYVFVKPVSGWADMTQTAKLSPSDGANNDWFGYSVAIFNRTIAIGAYHKNVAGATSQGAAYVFTQPPAGWTTAPAQAAKFTASDGAAYDYFGASVAIWGETVIVGADTDDSSAGSAHVFHRTGSSWVQSERKLAPSDGVLGDGFGEQVAISGGTAVVGAWRDDSYRGSAYVYQWDGSMWVQRAKLTASDRATDDYFGRAVAVSGDLVVVGAYGDDVGANAGQGSVYVFAKPTTGWADMTETAKVVASTGAANDSFGTAVAVSGLEIVVGANHSGGMGAAYVYEWDGTTASLRGKLTASDAVSGDNLGVSVAISGDVIVAGAYGDDSFKGSAYVFAKPPTGWTSMFQTAKLTVSDGSANDLFGQSVAISGDVIVAGAPTDNVVAIDQGAAYVFVKPAGQWVDATQTARLTAADGVNNDDLGGSVAISGDLVIAGAPADDDQGSNSGSAYVFVKPLNGWSTMTHTAKLLAADGAADETFGDGVAIDGDVAIVGSTNENAARGFYLGDECLASAVNTSSGTRYTSIADAISHASTGQGILGTSGAFTTGGDIDYRGKSLLIEATRGVAMPFSSDITMANGSMLAAAEGYPMTLFGQLRVAAGGAADVYADELQVGSAGLIDARLGSGLYLNVPIATVDGTIRAESNSTLSFTGLVTGNGPVEAVAGSTLYADEGLNLNGPATLLSADVFAGPVCVNGTLNYSDTYLSAPLLTIGASGQFTGYGNLYASVTNNNRFYSAGDVLIVGDVLNNAGAVITVQAGTTALMGSLTNNGTIVGQFSGGTITAVSESTGVGLTAGAPEAGDGLLVQGHYMAGPDSSLSLPGSIWRMTLAGNYDVGINNNTRYDMSQAELHLNGGAGVQQTLELMSKDIGPSLQGLDRTRPAHYPIGTLRLTSPATVQLVDNHDNDGEGQSACEALYVGSLVIDSGATLTTGSCRVYYGTLVNNGSVDDLSHLMRVCSLSIPGDFDADCDVDGVDLLAFEACATGPTIPQPDPACARALFDADDDVDQDDFAGFQRCWSGMLLADPNCK